MTTVVKQMGGEKPCQRCGKKEVWMLRYQSPGFVRLVFVCSTCNTASVRTEREYRIHHASSSLRNAEQ
jgi:endogenous inhibitor of DNA gyrase (YacG/DUF329 family)